MMLICRAVFRDFFLCASMATGLVFVVSSVFSFRFLWLHQRTSCSSSCRHTGSSPSLIVSLTVGSPAKLLVRVLGDAVACVECKEQWGQGTPLGSASAEGLGCGGELAQPQQLLQSARVLVILRELAGLSKVEQIG